MVGSEPLESGFTAFFQLTKFNRGDAEKTQSFAEIFLCAPLRKLRVSEVKLKN